MATDAVFASTDAAVRAYQAKTGLTRRHGGPGHARPSRPRL